MTSEEKLTAEESEMLTDALTGYGAACIRGHGHAEAGQRAVEAVVTAMDRVRRDEREECAEAITLIAMWSAGPSVESFVVRARETIRARGEGGGGS